MRAALDNPESFPNVNVLPRALGESLRVQAVYSGPAGLVDELLDAGVDVDPVVMDGFPILIATLSTDRPERHEFLAEFLRRGADPERRGINSWTALHWAVSRGDVHAVEILLTHGADIEARELIDDYLSVIEIAEARLAADLPGAREVLDLLTDQA